MVRKDGAELRKERIQEIRRMLKGIGTISLRKVLALIQIKHGLTKARGLEYLQLLEEFGDIKIDEGADLITEVSEGS